MSFSGIKYAFFLLQEYGCARILPFFAYRRRFFVLQAAFLLLASLLLWERSPLALAQALKVQRYAEVLAKQQIQEFPLPEGHSDPLGLTQGPDGALWFTEFDANQIGRMTLTGTFKEFALPSFRLPGGIVTGPDGNLWFTEQQGWIGRMTPTGALTEFPLPTTGAEPTAITTGPDGNLWFTVIAPNALGRITPAGHISLFPLAADTSPPSGITQGPDGNLWFIEEYGKIGFITLKGKIREFARPHMGSMAFGGITAGPDSTLWYTQGGGNGGGSLIGRMTLTGTIKTFPLAHTSANPVGIIRGPDGNLWFAELQSNEIGRITPQGKITEYPLPEKNGGPDYLVTGSDGNLWFTSAVNNFIGRISPAAP